MQYPWLVPIILYISFWALFYCGILLYCTVRGIIRLHYYRLFFGNLELTNG
jgi:hypothetical protein